MKKYVFSFRLIISAFLLIMAFLTILYLSFNYVKINLRSNEVDKHFSGDFIQVVDAYTFHNAASANTQCSRS